MNAIGTATARSGMSAQSGGRRKSHRKSHGRKSHRKSHSRKVHRRSHSRKQRK